MNAIDIKNLPLSSKASICWGFFWRGIVASLGSALCGGVLGAIAGFILGLAGAPKVAAAVGGVLGLGCGAVFLYLLIRWLLSSRLGSYKLVLVNANDAI
jgi:hypothetical protein